MSEDTLDHLTSVLESWKEDEEGLLVRLCIGWGGGGMNRETNVI